MKRVRYYREYSIQQPCVSDPRYLEMAGQNTKKCTSHRKHSLPRRGAVNAENIKLNMRIALAKSVAEGLNISCKRYTVYLY
ncbi:hypothetical protein ACJEQE_30180, partial [Klebsiella pneumoniae]